MRLEGGATPWDVSVQIGHEAGAHLFMERYGHPTDAGARARLLALWSDDVGPLRAVSGATREQAG